MLDIEYRDNSDIGRLMHDFNCTNASDMYFDLLAEKTRYLKENPKGVNEMCKVMEDLRNESYAEGREEQAKSTAIKLNQKGLPIEDIADSIGFSIETVKTGSHQRQFKFFKTIIRGSNSYEKLQDHSCRNGICGAVDCGIAFTAS